MVSHIFFSMASVLKGLCIS